MVHFIHKANSKCFSSCIKNIKNRGETAWKAKWNSRNENGVLFKWNKWTPPTSFFKNVLRCLAMDFLQIVSKQLSGHFPCSHYQQTAALIRFSLDIWVIFVQKLIQVWSYQIQVLPLTQLILLGRLGKLGSEAPCYVVRGVPQGSVLGPGSWIICTDLIVIFFLSLFMKHFCNKTPFKVRVFFWQIDRHTQQ